MRLNFKVSGLSRLCMFGRFTLAFGFLMVIVVRRVSIIAVSMREDVRRALAMQARSLPRQNSGLSKIAWHVQSYDPGCAAFLLLVLVSVACGAFNKTVFAGDVRTTDLAMALAAPDYGDRDGIHRHAGFSMIFAQALTEKYALAAGSEVCATVFATAKFPDLAVRVNVTSSSATKALSCLKIVLEMAAKATFTQVDINRAVTEISRLQKSEAITYRVADLSVARYERPRIVAMMKRAIEIIYAGDPVLGELSTIETWFSSQLNVYEEFISWLAKQRASAPIGYASVPLLPFATEVMDLARRDGVEIVLSSVSPVISPPSVVNSGSLVLNLNNIGSQSLLLVYCDRENPYCSQAVREQCASRNQAAKQGATLMTKCHHYDVMGLRSWYALWSGDDLHLAELHHALRHSLQPRYYNQARSQADWVIDVYAN